MSEKFLGTRSRFFAASNTGLGFKSYFEEIFPPTLSHIYILKGGPGCGKSTLLKRVAKYAQSKGDKTEIFSCSSSPESLDAVLLTDRKIAILDGTAPHSFEPRYAGVCETVVDMGKCWNLQTLKEKRQEIVALSQKKAQHYSLAYGYLSAARLANTKAAGLLDGAVVFGKLQKCAEKLYFTEKLSSKAHCISPRIISCLCKDGNLKLDTFEKLAKKKYVIKDSHGIGPAFFNELKRLCNRNGANAYISYDPLCPENADGFYFPEKELCITYGEKEDGDSTINTDRFLDKSAFSNVRSRYRFAKKCEKSLMSGAFCALADAAKAHDEIEALYAPSCDFFVADRIYRELLSEIF